MKPMISDVLNNTLKMVSEITPYELLNAISDWVWRALLFLKILSVN